MITIRILIKYVLLIIKALHHNPKDNKLNIKLSKCKGNSTKLNSFLNKKAFI